MFYFIYFVQWTTDQDLEDIFTPYGKIKNLRFFEEKVNGKSKGFALIEYQIPEAAITARDKINSRDIHGRQCLVELVSSNALKQLNRTGIFQSKDMKKKDSKEGMGYGGSRESGGPPPRGRGPPFNDSRNPYPAPHINPAFFRDYERDHPPRRDDYYRDRERDYPPPRDYSPDRRKRSRSRDREDRYRRDREDKDDYKRHRDSGRRH
jgi:RNA recognition motif-containing protein